MTTGPTVAIDRLACRFTVPSGMARQQPTVDRIVRIAERDLQGRFGQALVGSPLASDESVYRVRRLHVRTWLDALGMTGDQMAGRWAALLAAALHKELARTGNPNVVRFPSPRHYLAAFIADLVDGRAWQQWCYEEFRPLERLRPGAAAAHLLASRPAWAAGVLRLLDDSGHADRLVARLTATDVDRVWAALGLLDGPGPVPPADHATVLGVLPEVPLARLAGRDPVARDRMLLWMAAARRRPEQAGRPGLGRAVLRAVELAALLRHEPEAGPILAMGAPLYPALARRIATGPAAPALAWLGADPAAPSRPLAELAAALHAPPRVLSSPLGGVALLLPAIAAQGVWEAWEPAHGDGARRFLYAVLLKGAGRKAALLSLADGLVATLCGLAEPPLADARVPVDPASPVPWVPPGCEPATGEHDLALAGLGFPWLPNAVDAALSAVAAGAIRATAQRFPNVGKSGIGYFAGSFLAQPARLEPAGDRLVVHLGTGLAASLLPLTELAGPHAVPWLEQAVEFRAGDGRGTPG